MLVPIASAGMTAAHRDRLAVASVAQWPEVQPLVMLSDDRRS